jgi:LPXTG-motif cell wall-anchored protein
MEPKTVKQAVVGLTVMATLALGLAYLVRNKKKA